MQQVINTCQTGIKSATVPTAKRTSTRAQHSRSQKEQSKTETPDHWLHGRKGSAENAGARADQSRCTRAIDTKLQREGDLTITNKINAKKAAGWHEDTVSRWKDREAGRAARFKREEVVA